jgi:ankyrin repeat protein
MEANHFMIRIIQLARSYLLTVKKFKESLQCKHWDVEVKYGGQTLLLYVCNTRNIELIRFLVEHANANPFVRSDLFQRTALHIVCDYGNVKCARYLIEEVHVPVDLTNVDGETPLFNACRNCQFDCVKYLIEEAGSNVLHENKKGRTIQSNNKKLNELLEKYKQEAMAPLVKLAI